MNRQSRVQLVVWVEKEKELRLGAKKTLILKSCKLVRKNKQHLKNPHFEF